jgi:hypothetical protein
VSTVAFWLARKSTNGKYSPLTSLLQTSIKIKLFELGEVMDQQTKTGILQKNECVVADAPHQ